MRLSITQRLALTVAILGGLIIAPVCSLFYVALHRNMETRALDQAHAMASDVEHSLWPQFDEDMLFDFVDYQIDFGKCRVFSPDWAVIRGDGRVEAASGVLTDESRVPRETLQEIHEKSGRPYAVAAVPLKFNNVMTWTDMPRVMQESIEKRLPGTTFLWAKSRDVLERHTNFTVQMLGTQQIYNLSVNDQGQITGLLEDPLVKKLPAGLDPVLAETYGLTEYSITGWHAFNRALIATVQGRDPNGAVIHAGVDRFGQEYELDDQGVPVASLEPSRLYVVVALDVSHERARTVMLGRGIMAGGMGIWALMILVAWMVTRRALRPVHDIVLQADRIMPSKWNERLPVRPVTDDLSQVVQTINRMLDRLQQGYLRERQFTGDVSHEMRNPLAKIAAEVDWALSKDREVGEYKEILNRLKGYSQGMQQLIDSLLILARLDSGLQALDIQPFDVAELVIKTLKTCSNAGASRVHLDLGPSINPMIAIAHESLIGVLIGNLLDNALRYSPADSPVFLRIHRRAKTIHFSIEDQGPGIPEDQKALVFNRFHRLEKSRSKTTGGHGLGLAIVLAIAEVHHITIDMTSGTERGTVVGFSLPCTT